MSRTAVVKTEQGAAELPGLLHSPGTEVSADKASMTLYEFFAGGGMARLGFGKNWRCVFANDISPKKAAAYRENFTESSELHVGDIQSISANMLPGRADVMWGSFPCQDLSLAGQGAGLKGKRSGTFWPFMGLVGELRKDSRSPRVVVLENVAGTLTSHDGADFKAIISSLVREGYSTGAVVADSVHFVPQSRPRLFIIAAQQGSKIPDILAASGPSMMWHPKSLKRAHASLSRQLRKHWVWWNIPSPPARGRDLVDVVERTPTSVRWHTEEETAKLISMMSARNLEKLKQAQCCSVFSVGAVYKRTRCENGEKRQRAEVRFDGLSGCLRTPAGGSSRQVLVIVENDRIRSRLLSPREAARLMGVPNSYILPERYNEAYHLMGDGLVVPVVSWLEKHVIRPLVTENINLNSRISNVPPQKQS